jgi:glucose-1-phosphate cytidylyltransferase
MLYTGQNTMTGGRLLKAKDFIGNERFMLTYGDGVADINIPALLDCHEKSGKKVTLTAVRPAGRFGTLAVSDDGAIGCFQEKDEGSTSWVNGGFFVMEPAIFDYITEGNSTVLERKPLETLAKEGQLNAFRHDGFWRPMDTLKDKNDLTNLWMHDKAPWALWMNTNNTTK